MPLPVAAAAAYASAAYAAAVANLPTAGPVIGMAVLGLALVGSHEPNRLETAKLVNNPEAAAECVARNVSSLNTRLAAAVQPLSGTEVMGVVLTSRGEPIMSILIQESGPGSQAEFRPITRPEQQPDVIAQIIAGC